MSATAIEKQAFIDANLAALQGDWDDIDLPPEFATFPSGTYLFHVDKANLDTKKGKLGIVMILKEAIEVPDSELPVPEAGALFYAGFSLATKEGSGRIRKALGAVGQELGLAPMALIEQLPGLELVCDIRTSQDRDDKTRYFSNLEAAALAT